MELQSPKIPIKQYFIKGSGTSYCLINPSSQDQTQFVPFNFRHYLQPQDKQQNIKDVSMAGLYLLIQLENGKTYKLGIFNDQLIFKTPIPVFMHQIAIKSVSSGWDHTIFRGQDQRFWGLGSNKFLELSLKQEFKYLTQPIELDLSQKFVQNQVKTFVCGFRQSYFVTEGKELFGCGESKKYELGVKSLKPLPLNLIQKTEEKMLKLGVSKRALFGLSAAGTLFAMGTNDYGIFSHRSEKMSEDKYAQFYGGLVKIDTKVKDFVCGWTHIIVLKEDKDEFRLESYGRNNFGQLGRQSQIKGSNNKDPFTIDFEIGSKLSEISLTSGSQFVFCCKEGQLYGWGWNEHENVSQSKQQIIPRPIKIEYPNQNQLYCKRVWTYPAITLIETEHNK